MLCPELIESSQVAFSYSKAPHGADITSKLGFNSILHSGATTVDGVKYRDGVFLFIFTEELLNVPVVVNNVTVTITSFHGHDLNVIAELIEWSQDLLLNGLDI